MASDPNFRGVRIPNSLTIIICTAQCPKKTGEPILTWCVCFLKDEITKQPATVLTASDDEGSKTKEKKEFFYLGYPQCYSPTNYSELSNKSGATPIYFAKKNPSAMPLFDPPHLLIFRLSIFSHLK